MGGVAEKVGHQEGDDLPGGIGPPHDVGVRHRTLPEAAGDQLKERDQLYGAQAQTQPNHQCQPGREAQDRPPSS